MSSQKLSLPYRSRNTLREAKSLEGVILGVILRRWSLRRRHHLISLTHLQSQAPRVLLLQIAGGRVGSFALLRPALPLCWTGIGKLAKHCDIINNVNKMCDGDWFCTSYGVGGPC